MNNKKYQDFKPSLNWLLSNPIALIAFGFGSGLSPVAPGTIGSLVGVLIAWLFLEPGFSPIFVIFLCFIFYVFSIWITDHTEKLLGTKDDPGIVIDEIIAIILVLVTLPLQWYWWLFAFILFRIFDILKPWPINLFDKKVKGGFGIMLDDLLAAIYVVLICYIIQLLLNFF